MKIYIDDRERKIHERFIEVALKFGFETDIRRLEVGDIVVPEASFAVERKTPSDFVASLDKIFSQCGELKKNYENAFLVIDGDFSQVLASSGEMSHSSIVGATSSLMTRERVPVISAGPYFSELVCKMISKLTDGKTRELTARRERPKTGDRKLDVLCCVPGISATKAQELLAKFGSVRKVSDASVEEICEIPRIGLTLANRIKEILS
jgi:ERCC4-type nuclease